MLCFKLQYQRHNSKGSVFGGEYWNETQTFWKDFILVCATEYHYFSSFISFPDNFPIFSHIFNYIYKTISVSYTFFRFFLQENGRQLNAKATFHSNAIFLLFIALNFQNRLRRVFMSFITINQISFNIHSVLLFVFAISFGYLFWCFLP